MKKLLFLSLIFIFFSCRKENEEISFDSIEISYMNGFTASGGTILIKKDGSILKYYYGYPFDIDSSFYIIDSLKRNELNIVSKQVSDLIKMKFETINGEVCPDCTYKYILIKTKSKTLISNNNGKYDKRLISFCDSIYRNRDGYDLIKNKELYKKKMIYKKLYFKTYMELIPKPKFNEKLRR